MLINLAGNKIIIEPLIIPERKECERIIKEAAGAWKDIAPDHVDEQRGRLLQPPARAI